MIGYETSVILKRFVICDIILKLSHNSNIHHQNIKP
jgi:hypothetical protein